MAKKDNDTDTDEKKTGDAGQQQDLLDVTSKAYEDLDEEGNLSDETARLDGAAAQKAADDDQKGESDEAGDKGGEADDAGGEEDTGKPEDQESKTGKEGEGDDDGKKDKDADLELTDEEKGELSERSRQRFESLAERVKSSGQELEARNAEFDQLRQQHDTLVGVIQEANASPEQLGQLLDITGDLTSGHLQRGQQGVQRAYALVQEYAKQYGVTLPSHDVLADHPDLQQQVEQGHATKELAEQTAAARNANQGQQLFQSQQQAQVQQAQQMQTDAQQAGQALNQLQQDWQSKDADWPHKAPLLNQYANQLVQQFQAGKVAASDIPHLMRSRYDTVTETMKVTADSLRQQGRDKDPNPVRPGPNKHAQTNKNYGSTEEAIIETYRNM